MDVIPLIAAGVFGAGYVLIALEKKLGTHKSAIALMMAGMLWLLTAAYMQHQTPELKEMLSHAGSEIFGVVMFLLAAMALIEILVHYGLFDLVRAKLVALKMRDKQQFILLLAITFIFSALLDNIAITIASIQIARRFFTGRNLVVAGAGIVIAANAGGAWSPVGDVTTVLLWLAEKFTAFEVVRYAFLPSAALAVVATAMLYRKLNDTNFTKLEKVDLVPPSLSEKAIIATALASFTLPLIVSGVGLPPYMGLLFGLGITWGMIEFAKLKSRHEHQSHLTANLEKLVQTVDISSIKFVAGILLSVSALAALGVMAYVSNVALGESVDATKAIIFSISIGVLSSIVDNSSLVAMAINMLHIDNPEIWALLAITVGTGGSMMVVASAAGVVAMGAMKELTVGTYFKIATVPAFAGFVVAIGVWMLQYFLL